MGLFSTIGSIGGGILGGIFGGPAGAGVGSTIGGGLGTLLEDNAGAAVSGYATYEGQREANATNLAIAREANLAEKERQERGIEATYELQGRQFAKQDFLALRQQEFQERMANSAFSRAVVDMRRAGINPILAAGAQAPTAQGASGSATGGTAPGGRAHTARVENALGQAVQSAVAARQLRENIKTADVQRGNIRSDTYLKDDQSALAAEQADRTAAETRRINQETEKAKIETATAKEVQRIRKREAEDTEKYGSSNLGKEAAGVERVIQRLLDALK